MKLSTILIGGTALIGLGMYLGRKLNENNSSNEVKLYTEEKETYGDKFHKASMYAVGAVKTGAEKIAQSIKEIKSQDMVKKGEETVSQVKETSEQIKQDISDLKDMAVSINETVTENIFIDEDDSVMETQSNPFDDAEQM